MINEVFYGSIDSAPQGLVPLFDRYDLSTCKFHIVDVWTLSFIVFFSHIDDTCESKLRSDARRSKPMLSCSRFSDDSFLSEIFCEKYLTDTMIDLMSSGMIGALIFYIDLSSSYFLTEMSAIGKWGGSPDKIFIKIMEFSLEFFCVFDFEKPFLKLIHNGDEHLRNVATSEFSEISRRMYDSIFEVHII